MMHVISIALQVIGALVVLAAFPFALLALLFRGGTNLFE